MRHRPNIVAPMLVAAVALGLLAGACGDATDSPPSTTPPVTAGRPDGAGSPGDLLDVEPAPSVSGATAMRITYRSVDIAGAPSLATALVVTPEGAAPGAPVIAWGHPTTGTGDACAPSQLGAAGIPDVGVLLAKGWVVVAADYEGLGASGPHPYLVSDSESRSIFDALAAAAAMPDGAVSPRAPVVLWGFSQGGHAVLAAAERAGRLAPDLDVRGVAVAAPVSDVTAFLQRSMHPSQLGVVLAIVHGARLAAPDLDPADLLTDTGAELLASVDRRCISELMLAATLPTDEVLRADPSEQPAWRAVLDAQRPGVDGIGMPVLVIHGTDDEIIPVADSDALVRRLCAAGDPVQYITRPGDDHSVAPEPGLTDWIAARVDGHPPPSGCAAAP